MALSHLERGLTTNRYMDLDDQGQEFLKSAIMEPKGGRSHPTLGRLFPAAIALWHSPIFILDPSIDLTAFDFRTKDFTLQKLVNVSDFHLSPLMES